MLRSGGLFISYPPKITVNKTKSLINTIASYNMVTDRTLPYREGFKKKCEIFRTLMGWVGLKKSFSTKKNIAKHGLKMPKNLNI